MALKKHKIGNAHGIKYSCAFNVIFFLATELQYFQNNMEIHFFFCEVFLFSSPGLTVIVEPTQASEQGYLYWKICAKFLNSHKFRSRKTAIQMCKLVDTEMAKDDF